LEAVQEVRAKAKEIAGLELNPAKSKVLGRDIERDTLEETFEGFDVSTEGQTVLGVPMGTDRFVKWELAKEMEKCTRVLDHLRHEDYTVQEAAWLLRCSYVHKFTFWCRCVKPSLTAEFAKAFDEGVLRFVKEKLLGNVRQDLTGLQLKVVHLPTRLGGLGFGSALRIHEAAYVASVCNSLAHGELSADQLGVIWPDMQRSISTLYNSLSQAPPREKQKLRDKLGKVLLAPPLLPVEDTWARHKDFFVQEPVRAKHMQRVVTEVLHDFTLSDVTSLAEHREPALYDRLQAYTGKGATRVLHVAPSSNLNKIQDDAMMYEFRNRLALAPLLPADHLPELCPTCPRGRGPPMLLKDNLHHLQSCSYGSNIEGFTRHEALKAVIIRFAREVCFPVADANLETLNRDPSEGDLRPDLRVIGATHAKEHNVLIDVSVAHDFASHVNRETRVVANQEVMQRVAHKLSKYHSYMQRNSRFKLLPVVFGTSTTASDQVREFANILVDQATDLGPGGVRYDSPWKLGQAFLDAMAVTVCNHNVLMRNAGYQRMRDREVEEDR